MKIKNIDLLEAKISKVLKDANFKSVLLANKITQRKNGRVKLFRRKYKTLLVVIEKGEGKNWWEHFISRLS